MSKTLKISEETHRLLTKVKGELTARDGKLKTFDETIAELIDFWRKKKLEDQRQGYFRV